MITIHHISKSFHKRPAMQDLSFEAPDGAITGLLGANGAGKSTTLRMICGALQPDKGVIDIDGAPTGDPLERQRRVSALLDHTGIYSRLTVRENLAYFGRLRGMPPESLEQRVTADRRRRAEVGLDADLAPGGVGLLGPQDGGGDGGEVGPHGRALAVEAVAFHALLLEHRPPFAGVARQGQGGAVALQDALAAWPRKQGTVNRYNCTQSSYLLRQLTSRILLLLAVLGSVAVVFWFAAFT